MSDEIWEFFFILVAVALGVALVLWLLYFIFIVLWYITYPTLALATGGTIWWRVSGRFSYERKRAEAALWTKQRWVEVKTWVRTRGR